MPTDPPSPETPATITQLCDRFAIFGSSREALSQRFAELEANWKVVQDSQEQEIAFLRANSLTPEEARVLYRDISDDEGFLTLNDEQIEAWDSAVEKLRLLSESQKGP